MLEYTITAHRTAPSLAEASSTRATAALLPLDTAPDGRTDAFNPAELLLTALAACMLKALERVLPMLKFSLRDATVRVHGVRQDVPPRLVTVDYEIIVETDESDERLDLLHRNVQKYGTVYNTLARAVKLSGAIHRAGAPAHAMTPMPASMQPPGSVAASIDELC